MFLFGYVHARQGHSTGYFWQYVPKPKYGVYPCKPPMVKVWDSYMQPHNHDFWVGYMLFMAGEKFDNTTYINDYLASNGS